RRDEDRNAVRPESDPGAPASRARQPASRGGPRERADEQDQPVPDEGVRIRRATVVEEVGLGGVERLGERAQRPRCLPPRRRRTGAGHLEIDLAAPPAGGDELERDVLQLPAEVRRGGREPLRGEGLLDAEPDGWPRRHGGQHAVDAGHLLRQPLAGVHRAAAGVGRNQAPLLADEERGAGGTLDALQIRLQRSGRHPQRPTRAGERAVAREGEDETELLPGKDHACRASPGTFTPAKVWPASPQPRNGVADSAFSITPSAAWPRAVRSTISCAFSSALPAYLTQNRTVAT